MYEAFESDKNIYPECDCRNDSVRFFLISVNAIRAEEFKIFRPNLIIL